MINERFYTMAAIVDQILTDLGESHHRFEQFLSWGLWGYREFHFDSLQEVKAVKVAMNAVKKILLPNDYVDWVVVVGLVGGKAQVLDVNDQLPLIQSAYPNNTKDEIFTRSIKDFFHSYGQFLRDGPQVWSSKGHFRVNREEGTIQFAPGVNTGEIYMEYISDGFVAGQQTIVHPYVADTVRAYIHWQRLKFSKTANQYDKETAKRDFIEAKNRSIARLDDLNAGETSRNITLQANITAPEPDPGDFSDDFSEDFQVVQP